MSTVTWHDVECAGYREDLPVWRDLAARCPGPVLDVGCGTGRVALDLARLGHDVTGLDSQAELVEELRARAREELLQVHAETADARSFELDRCFALVIAPMQVVQLLGGEAGRLSFLEHAARHLAPGGLVALALADPLEGAPAEASLLPLPDVLERDGWVYSSTPVAMRTDAGGVTIERVREAAAPGGTTQRAATSITLDLVTADQLEREGARRGLRALERLQVPETHAYVGSTVVCMEAR